MDRKKEKTSMLPQPIEDCLKGWFSFPKDDVFCQVSTMSRNQPHIRTMRLYDITKEGFPVVITSTDTRKWQDCELNSQAALCLFHPIHGQLIMEGQVHLKTSKHEIDSIQRYWEMLPPYWQDFYRSKASDRDQSTDKIPDSFGVIVLEPQFWEILEICSTDYLQSSRSQFHLIDNCWHMSKVAPV
jgi:general stress protein 26